MNLALILRLTNKMFVTYMMLFVGVCVLLPLALEASGTCDPVRRTNAETQRAEDGRALCATSPATKTLTANFKVECLSHCMGSESCRHGFNYRSEAQLCELYSDEPTSYEIQQDCDYLKVGCSLSIITSHGEN